MENFIHNLESIVAKKKVELTSYHSYSPEELFQYNGTPVFSVLDFWRYAYSQLDGLSDTLAEFFVAKALSIEKAENVNYWTAYDMAYRNKRIEVKATSYVHPWNKQISNVRTFSIAPTHNNYWGLANECSHNEQTLSRQSEIYVFCLNHNKDIQKNNPLLIDNWTFYVIPTFEINNYCNKNPLQKRISLSVVKKLASKGVSFGELKQEVDAAIEKSDCFYKR